MIESKFGLVLISYAGLGPAISVVIILCTFSATQFIITSFIFIKSNYQQPGLIVITYFYVILIYDQYYQCVLLTIFIMMIFSDLLIDLI